MHRVLAAVVLMSCAVTGSAQKAMPLESHADGAAALVAQGRASRSRPKDPLSEWKRPADWPHPPASGAQERLDRELLAAVLADDVPAARAALAKGADPIAEFRGTNALDYQAAVCRAAGEGSAAMMRLLLDTPSNGRRVDPNLVCDTGCGNTLVAHAIGRYERVADGPAVLRLLLERGAKPESGHCGGWESTVASALVHASFPSSGYDFSYIDILLEAGADINYRGRYTHQAVDGLGMNFAANEGQATGSLRALRYAFARGARPSLELLENAARSASIETAHDLPAERDAIRELHRLAWEAVASRKAACQADSAALAIASAMPAARDAGGAPVQLSPQARRDWYESVQRLADRGCLSLVRGIDLLAPRVRTP